MYLIKKYLKLRNKFLKYKKIKLNRIVKLFILIITISKILVT